MTFTARGRVTFEAVIFVIEAKNHDEAWAKAMAGDYVRYDLNDADLTGWTIKTSTLEGHK